LWKHFVKFQDFSRTFDKYKENSRTFKDFPGHFSNSRTFQDFPGPVGTLQEKLRGISH
jgi:hypothetical protein